MRRRLCAALLLASPAHVAHTQILDSLPVPLVRSGSGTTWTTDAATLPSLHFKRDKWEYMVRGVVFLQYTNQPGPRGASQLGSINWGMFTASRQAGGGRLSFRSMLSLEPLTVTPDGYPLLLQGGPGRWDTTRLSPDRMPPQDLLVELGVLYERPFTKHLGFSLYAAPAGQPALSPVAFMNRPSAMDNPFAPLGYAWEDKPPASYGVLTSGLFTEYLKVEVSAFNARRPDENRDMVVRPGPLNSRSWRVTLNPTANVSMTFGHGAFVDRPKFYDERRIVGSLLYGHRIGEVGQVAASLIAGRIARYERDPGTSMLAAETEAVFNARNTFFARVESGHKTPQQLEINTCGPGTSKCSPRFAPYPMGSVTGGHIVEIASVTRATIGLGAMGTINTLPATLVPYYGSRYPMAFTAFFRVRPTLRARTR